jgi:hypothetical protein
MILTSSPQSVADSRSFSGSEHIPKLADCDDVFTYRECGYFCVIGSKNGRRIVHAHMGDAEAFRSELDWHGYRLSGRALVPMSDEEHAEARGNSWKGSFHPKRRA